MPIWKKNK